ncbi:MgtC/SapB family protein [Rehaibacterium terrae]|jgi:putative Mg2+ transporter-C (MgtC) family protein|uniref:Protein MgtC n=1 Tax=Rehaibacterium terrae TaxID=1341696 RepID=A0A7W7Y1J8_9GAMM|nr:MgtC/SapB family protein [Rehaibacterium terrae]MBB5016168.1 putative Mg2+ transporter-C (MgtC) family protein [Rehaibacterium terrae]
MDPIHFMELAARLGVGLVLGALIGLERQWRQRMAGLRTNALVALGAAAFTAFSMLVPEEVSPTRVAAQVVSGIGFLGAGVILREGVNVRGLNTAATLWCAAAVGVLAGAGYPAPAALIALLVVAANTALRPLAHAIGRRGGNETEIEHSLHYRLLIECDEGVELHVRALVLQALSAGALRLQRLASDELDGHTPRVRLQADLVALVRADDALEQAVRRFGLEPGVRAIAWHRDSGDPS